MESVSAAHPSATSGIRLSDGTVRSSRRVQFTYVALLFGLGTSSSLFGPSLPFLSRSTGVSLGDIGVIFTVKGVGVLVGSLVLGRLFDRFERHTIMRWCLGLFVPTLLVVPLLSDFPLILTLLFINGIAEGGLHVGSNVLVVRALGDRSGPALNLLHFGFGVGATLSPFLVGLALRETGSVVLTFVFASFVLLLVGLLFLIPEPEGPLSEQESTASDTTPSTRSPLPVLLLYAAVFMFYCGAEGSFSSWIYTFALSSGISNQLIAGLLTSLFWGGLTLGRMTGIFLAKRFRPGQIIATDMFFGLLALVSLLLFPVTQWSIGVLAFLVGAAYATIFPMTMVRAELDVGLSGNNTGWFFTGAASGGMIFPWVTGYLMNSRSIESSPVMDGMSGGSTILPYACLIYLAASGSFFLILRYLRPSSGSTVIRNSAVN